MGTLQDMGGKQKLQAITQEQELDNMLAAKCSLQVKPSLQVYIKPEGGNVEFLFFEA